MVLILILITKHTIATQKTTFPSTQILHCHGMLKHVLNVFIDIQTSKELIQMDIDKMMTYGTYTMDDEKLTQS